MTLRAGKHLPRATNFTQFNSGSQDIYGSVAVLLEIPFLERQELKQPGQRSPKKSSLRYSQTMVTCFLRYEIDVKKITEFEHYGRLWIHLVNKMGGKHHGYLLPAEGANDIALASFTFPSLAAYELYRQAAIADPECQAAYAYANETNCIRRHERTFFRPIFE
jgi:hypothetical protein